MAGVFETQNVYLLSKYSNPFLQVFFSGLNTAFNNLPIESYITIVEHL